MINIIPHKCAFCNLQLMYNKEDKNFIYFKGVYYCDKCFNNKIEKRISLYKRK
jgi:hypothetical protein